MWSANIFSVLYVVGVPPGHGAALHTAQRRAGTAAYAVRMVIAAVSGSAVGVPARYGAALHGAYAAGCDGGLGRILMVMSAVSRRGEHEHQCSQDRRRSRSDPLCLLHGNSSFRPAIRGRTCSAYSLPH